MQADARRKFRTHFKALCERAERTRKGERLSDKMTQRGSEMSCRLSFGQLNASSLFGRFAGEQIAKLPRDVLKHLLNLAPKSCRQKLDLLKDDDKDFEGQRVGFGDDVFANPLNSSLGSTCQVCSCAPLKTTGEAEAL